MSHRRCCCGNEQPPVPCTGCCPTCPPGTTCTTFPLGGGAWCDAPAAHPCCQPMRCEIKFDIQPKMVDVACNLTDAYLHDGACTPKIPVPRVTCEWQGVLQGDARPGGCDACQANFIPDASPFPGPPGGFFRRVQLSCLSGGAAQEEWGYEADIELIYICNRRIRMRVSFYLTFVQSVNDPAPCSGAFDRGVASVLSAEAQYLQISPNGACNTGGTYELDPLYSLPGGVSYDLAQWFTATKQCSCAKLYGAGSCPPCFTPPVIDYTLQFPNTITVA